MFVSGAANRPFTGKIPQRIMQPEDGREVLETWCLSPGKRWEVQVTEKEERWGHDRRPPVRISRIPPDP